MSEDFWNELLEGEIHVRDNLQFELKSEFFINAHLKHNIYKQEFFIFIPKSLQINPLTYTKKQFYLDQTTLIRYRTPSITLTDLIDPNYAPSPLNRIQHLLNHTRTNQFFSHLSDEIKLFGVMFRTSLRDKVYKILQELEHPTETHGSPVAVLCSEIQNVCLKFRNMQQLATNSLTNNQLKRYFKYVDEFMSTTIEECLLVLLKQIRSLKQHHQSQDDKQISELILKEKAYRKKNKLTPKTSKGHFFSNESILYRKGLLNTFILESLMLKTFRFSLEEKHSNLLGAIAAGLAMFVYMLLFVWKSPEFVINSFAFVALAVILYILKDRLKEGFKQLYYKKASRWFPDYSTEILNPKGFKIGVLKENFAFIDSKQLSSRFASIRNHQFHEELQALSRHETILHYKREVILHHPQESTNERRRRELTTIFRLNVYHFLQKASNALQSNLTFDSYTHEIIERMLPKVYHLNIIIRNSYLSDDLKSKIEIKTFRVVVDKMGIKRVEHLKKGDS